MAETTADALAVRSEVIDLLDGYFRFTLRLDIDTDIPAAADDIVKLCGRWVAEALESAAAGGSPMDDLAGDLTVSAVTSTRLRHLAAEYRDGIR